MNGSLPHIPAKATAAGSAAVLALAALVGCAADDSSGSDGKVQVVASFYPLQYITEQIGGNLVEVHNLTKPGVEPHELELSTRQAGELADADLVVYLKGLQPAVDQAVRQSDIKHVAEVTEFSKLVAFGTGQHVADEDGEEANATGDPHIWLDPTRLAQVAEGVRKRLTEADPDHASAYQAGAKKLTSQLTTLDREYSASLRTCSTRTFITSHAAFGYLAERYHLDQEAISGLNPESEPSPAHRAELEKIAKAKNVSTIFYETLVDPKTAKALASDLGLKTAVLDPIEGVKNPAKDNYLSIMHNNLTNLKAALGCA